MKGALFITGAGGFLGRRLLSQLDFSAYSRVVCFDRQLENLRLPDPHPQNIRFLEGDIRHSSDYRHHLEQVETVIHLAAVTGKANPKQYRSINTLGTRELVGCCRESGVKNFLFVSTIAVNFKKTHRYFYAHSKIEAESCVGSSGLNTTILRPTMIMGENSPVFQGLALLARLPVVPVFGNGKTMIQPLHVEDAAKAIIQILDHDHFHGERIEIGGSETLSIETFLKRIAAQGYHKNPPIIHLPMTPTVFGLSLLERIAYPLMPITVGQLATFRNDGRAADSALLRSLHPGMKTISQIIQDGLIPAKAAPKDSDISRECSVLSRYLVHKEPDSIVMESYFRCHNTISFVCMDFHDRLLMSLGRSTPLLTRTADAYSRFFRPHSVLRKKLAYLAGILEVSPRHFRFYESPDVSGLTGFIVKLGLKGMGLALHLLLATPILLPLQILARLSGRKEQGQNREDKG